MNSNTGATADLADAQEASSSENLKVLSEQIEELETGDQVPEETVPITEEPEQTLTEDNLEKELPYKMYKMKNIPTMFGEIHENNVVFCIDTSGSMISALDAVKEHLVEVLMQRAENNPNAMFNVIEFSNEVTQWSDRMVQCNPQTVAVASEWIKKLEPKTCTNTLDALMTAFSDPDCEAVSLVTDGYPSQNPTDILDNVAYASQNRPIHCCYIEHGNPDVSATEFLRDLAMETYGSLHVISITLHGSIERITPLYRAELSAERIVRTTDGNIYPSNHKICSVATTLNHPLPEVVVERPPTVVSYAPPLYPNYFYPYPYRYQLQHQYPDVGWSRYRPARAALNQPMAAFENFTPGAGAMLIGSKVLARRNADGHFYVGTVKSQIMDNKFLIEFGPCKHGKYKDTSYQETFVYDIVSQTDALRHSVCVSDKVLAPWEPEGERFGPGVVIAGQEKRVAEGGGLDEDLIVTFHNGKSATIPRDTAVWIPYELHERITFELQLPKKVRCDFAEQDKPYPEENLPGYPTSGPRASPGEFEVHNSGWIPRNDPVTIRRGGYLYTPFHSPLYPVYYKYQPKPSDVKSEEIDSAVPGTDMTKEQLNEKVMSQLMRYKMVLEGKKDLKDLDNSRLLKKRHTLEENTMTKKSLEKSVTFKDADSDLEPEAGDLDMRDSGHGSPTDLGTSDIEFDDDFTYEAECEDAGRDAAVQVDPRVYYRYRRGKTAQRPRWSYWNKDPAPNLLEPMHEGPYRVGPFEEPMTPIPWQMKTRTQEDGMEGSSNALLQYADYLAKYKQDGASVGDCMHVPKPPDCKPEKQGPGRSVSESLHGNLSEADKLSQMRLDFRRRRALKREEDWHKSYEEGERMKALMVDQHKDHIETQNRKEEQRHIQEMERVRLLREAKKEINEQLRNRIQGNQDREQAREGQRLEALRARRERMEDIRRKRETELEEIKAKREVARRQCNDARWESRAEKQREQEAQTITRNQQAHAAKLQRFENFRKREAESLRYKQLQAENVENKSAIFRSRIFP